jgi:hypothetical protein
MKEYIIMKAETYRELEKKARRAEMLEAELRDVAKMLETLLEEKQTKEKGETYHYIYVEEV